MRHISLHVSWPCFSIVISNITTFSKLHWKKDPIRSNQSDCFLWWPKPCLLLDTLIHGTQCMFSVLVVLHYYNVLGTKLIWYFRTFYVSRNNFCNICNMYSLVCSRSLIQYLTAMFITLQASHFLCGCTTIPRAICTDVGFFNTYSTILVFLRNLSICFPNRL